MVLPLQRGQHGWRRLPQEREAEVSCAVERGGRKAGQTAVPATGQRGDSRQSTTALAEARSSETGEGCQVLGGYGQNMEMRNQSREPETMDIRSGA